MKIKFEIDFASQDEHITSRVTQDNSIHVNRTNTNGDRRTMQIFLLLFAK